MKQGLTLHSKMCSEIWNHTSKLIQMFILSAVHTKVGTHEMCSDVYTRMGNGDTTQKICSDVHTWGGGHCTETFILGGAHRT